MAATKIEYRPLPRFQHRQAIRVPPEVHDDQKAEIVGHEWGPDKGYGKRGPGWIYYIKFPDGGEWWIATEQELIEWDSQV
jgi:hypothetical protein